MENIKCDIKSIEYEFKPEENIFGLELKLLIFFNSIFMNRCNWSPSFIASESKYGITFRS